MLLIHIAAWTVLSAAAPAPPGGDALMLRTRAAEAPRGLGDPAWELAPANPLQLHRTPPLYADGPFDGGERPRAFARLVRDASGGLHVRLEWDDPAENVPGEGTVYPDGGETHVYKAHTENPGAFADAACVMVPKSRGPAAAYPSMMMGDGENPVDLYFWQAGGGGELLQAHGRSTTEAVPVPAAAHGARTARGWAVAFELPPVEAFTPLCFAIWDGGKDHRDGLKYYSLWYEAAP